MILNNRLYMKLVTIMIIFSLSSCGLEKSYTEFYISGFENFNPNDSESWEAVEFSSVYDIVIVPSIKEVKHGVYRLYVSAYAKTEPSNLVIKNIDLTNNENTMISNQSDNAIEFILTDENIFDGYVEAGTFEDMNDIIVDGSTLVLALTIEVEKETGIIVEDKNYDIIVKGYKSLNME